MKRHRRAGNLVARQTAFRKVNEKSNIREGEFHNPGSQNRHKGCGPGDMTPDRDKKR